MWDKHEGLLLKSLYEKKIIIMIINRDQKVVSKMSGYQ